MPSRHAIDPPSRLARVWMTGHVDAEAKLAAIEALHADPLWDVSFATIWDGTGASQVVVLPTDVPPLLEAFTTGDAGMDLFYGEQGMAYLMAKLFALLEGRRGKEAHVCPTMADVLERLGRSDLPVALQDPDGGATNRKVA